MSLLTVFGICFLFGAVIGALAAAVFLLAAVRRHESALPAPARIEVVGLSPGDCVVVSLDFVPTHDQRIALKAMLLEDLRASFPGVEIVVLEKGASIDVLRRGGCVAEGGAA
ncbi:hypothetical protein [Parvibaculum sp. MBR-TMA-1.3b-4.2]|jgi:hypothetical protein